MRPRCRTLCEVRPYGNRELCLRANSEERCGEDTQDRRGVRALSVSNDERGISLNYALTFNPPHQNKKESKRTIFASFLIRSAQPLKFENSRPPRRNVTLSARARRASKQRTAQSASTIPRLQNRDNRAGTPRTTPPVTHQEERIRSRFLS